jgi:Pyruvate/2-oxoacid:ferredoxin oxidoreductase delta subunit
MIIIYPFYRSWGLLADLFVAPCFMWWLYVGIGSKSISFVYLPVITAVWMLVAHYMKGKGSHFLAWSVPFLWFILSTETPVAHYSLPHYLILLSCFLMILVFTKMRYIHPDKLRKKIDFLVCSYSGHTAHFINQFMEGTKSIGAKAKVFRFHHYNSFHPEFNGDSLVIAFPVYGFKPPWPFLYYLVYKLPRGKGKPAYILYTCIGGAENAGMMCWLILTLKGYRVVGRNLGVYPLNVTTFRLGPAKLWKFLDTLVPRRPESDFQRECGKRFAAGLPGGLPFIFGLTPGFLVGILIDHKWIDTILYRNHVMKKRCNQCEICIDYCPAERLSMVKGYPKARGAFMICLGCVNLCPTNAMHLWCWTEYGNQYKSRYKKLIVKKKPNIGGMNQHDIC